MSVNQETVSRPVLDFYDGGWNARLRGEEYSLWSTQDWRDGWKDCDELYDQERKDIGEI